MRVWLRRNRIGATLIGVVLMAACSTNATNSTQSPAPTADAPAGLVPVTVQVDRDLAQPPFDEPRQAMVPAGWSLSVWARVPNARLAAWAPDGSLLVSVPSSGQVVRVQPNGAGARMSVRSLCSSFADYPPAHPTSLTVRPNRCARSSIFTIGASI